jgi:RNA polymerase sigma-70 factor, ECF subfamily
MTPLFAHARGERAFERLYRRHVGDVYRYTLALLRNPDDAEDVTQTTFMNAYRAFGRGERPRNARAWLLAIAHNVCRQRFRAASRRPTEVELDEDYASVAVPDEQGPSAADIRRALDQLAFNQRAALVMRELEGRSYAEIAQVLGLSVGAVETLVFRARRALREQLEGSLSCHEAERAISRQIDGALPRAEKGALRAHLRECGDCAHFARSQRAQRSAWKTLATVPLPSTLQSFFGAGGAASTAGGAGGVAVGAAVAKTLAAAAIGVTAVGIGYEGVQSQPWRSSPPSVQERIAPAASVRSPLGATLARAVAEQTRVGARPHASVSAEKQKRKQKQKRKAQVAAPLETIAAAAPERAQKAKRAKSERPVQADHPGKAKQATKSTKAKRGAPAAPRSAPVRARGNPSPPGQAGKKTASPVRRGEAEKVKEETDRPRAPELVPELPAAPQLPLAELPRKPK